jgi:cytochrome oxidase assembly protein ShyY1
MSSSKKNIGALLLFCTLSVGCYFLSGWQKSRALEKRALIKTLSQPVSHELALYQQSIIMLTAVKESPYVLIERADKSYEIYQPVRLNDHRKFLLSWGCSRNPYSVALLKDQGVLKEPTRYRVRAWPVMNNPFIYYRLKDVDGILESYQVGHALQHPLLHEYNQQVVLLIEEPPIFLDKKDYKIPLLPERHEAYALQWLLLSFGAAFFALIFGTLTYQDFFSRK